MSLAGEPRLLIVDDEKPIVVLFSAILRSAFGAANIDTAADGAEAVECFRRKRHQVLLMDLHMPVMDGFSAFRAIEQMCRREAFSMPAVVFCTGFSPPDALSRVLDGNSRHGCILKPISPEDLVIAVESRLLV